MSEDDARFPSLGVNIASVAPLMTFACGVALVVLRRHKTWILHLATVLKGARGSTVNSLPLSSAVTCCVRMAEFVDMVKNESIRFRMRLFMKDPV